MGFLAKWFRRKKKVKTSPLKEFSSVETAIEDAKVSIEEKEHLPVFQHLKNFQKSEESVDTLRAISDVHTRRLIVTRRIKQMKCWILALAFVAFVRTTCKRERYRVTTPICPIRKMISSTLCFQLKRLMSKIRVIDPEDEEAVKQLSRANILFRALWDSYKALSAPFTYILYSTHTNRGEEKQTIGFGLIDRHVQGTALLEMIISTILLLVSIARVIWPKNESLYYFAQISYLFAVCQYGFLVPLHIRSCHKNMSKLKLLMRREGDIGRCVKVETDVVIPSKRETYKQVVDTHGCTLHQRKMNLPHIRPILKIECDGPDSWYEKAMAYTNLSTKYPKQPQDTWYEVNSQLWTATQRIHRCCGIEGNLDWTKDFTEIEDLNTHGKSHWNGQNVDRSLFVFPRSCCPMHVPICFANATHGPNCYPFLELTVLAHSAGLLITLAGCGVANTVIFILLIRLRRMVEKFRPDLLQL